MGKKDKKKQDCGKCGEWEFEKLPEDLDYIPSPHEYRRKIVETNSILTELIEERALVDHLSEELQVYRGYSERAEKNWHREELEHRQTKLEKSWAEGEAKSHKRMAYVFMGLALVLLFIVSVTSCEVEIKNEPIPTNSKGDK